MDMKVAKKLGLKDRYNLMTRDLEWTPTYQAVQGNLTAASTSYGVDFELLKAVVSAESAFNPMAVSNKGATDPLTPSPRNS